MKYLLDTNICSYVIRQRPPTVISRFIKLQPGEVALSSITVAELEYGAAKSSQPARNRQALDMFLAPLVIEPFDEAATRHYGQLRAELERAGQIIGPLDMLIAAHAMSLGLIMVTRNTREFMRVRNLLVEDWV